MESRVTMRNIYDHRIEKIEHELKGEHYRKSFTSKETPGGCFRLLNTIYCTMHTSTLMRYAIYCNQKLF